jgi:molybdopterin/thiamine biosynthesis adenylyltransferase/rhodanese-related sulfurtransferase
VKNTNRYNRQIVLPEIGDLGQQKLQNAKVLVIGAGGLGCPVLQNLAAAGVGFIGIADGDVVETTNLHRQLLYCPDDCGKNKAETAAKALNRLNPEVTVKVFPDFFTPKNANEIVGDYQIIVDCTDSLAVRYLINDMALVKNIPVVYAAIHKFEGQVSVFNYQDGPSYRCLFPETESPNGIPNCATTGVLGVLPNTLGLFQATEVLKIILEIGTVLSGKLLIYDALQQQTQIIAFQKNPFEIEKGRANGTLLLKQPPEKPIADLEPDAFLEKCNHTDTLLIDIREIYEEPRLDYKNLINIPLATLENFMETLDKNQEIIVFCQSGLRSQFVMGFLKREGFKQVSHLKNGIESIEKNLLNEL